MPTSISSHLTQVEGKVLASHGDGTFTIKYADGQTEEDAPKECVRTPPAPARDRGGRSRNASRGKGEGRAKTGGGGGESLWSTVERMASELAKRAGLQRKRASSSSLEREEDEVAC